MSCQPVTSPKQRAVSRCTWRWEKDSYHGCSCFPSPARALVGMRSSGTLHNGRPYFQSGSHWGPRADQELILSLGLSFRLTFLKSAVQLFVECPSTGFWLPDTSWLALGYAFEAEIPSDITWEDTCCFFCFLPPTWAVHWHWGNTALRDTTQTAVCQASSSKWRNLNLLNQTSIPSSSFGQSDYQFSGVPWRQPTPGALQAGSWELTGRTTALQVLESPPPPQVSHPPGLAGVGTEEKATSLRSFWFMSGKLRCLQGDLHQGWTANTLLGNLLPTTGHPISPGLASKHSFPIHYSSRQSRPRGRGDTAGNGRSSSP